MVSMIILTTAIENGMSSKFLSVACLSCEINLKVYVCDIEQDEAKSNDRSQENIDLTYWMSRLEQFAHYKRSESKRNGFGRSHENKEHIRQIVQ